MTLGCRFSLFLLYCIQFHTVHLQKTTLHPGHFNGAKDPVLIEYPNAIIEAAGPDGHIYLESGRNGNIVFQTNDTNTVYFDKNDLLHFIQEVNSQPPIWKEHSPFGYLGRFDGGQSVSVQVHATDPEGGPISYHLIAGDFPPGISLDTSNGRIYGLIPDANALFQFTLRATDNHGKFADLPFKMDVDDINNCENKPCQHEGVCKDMVADFHCDCVHPYGGKTCNIDCRNNYLGIDYNRRYIPNAQITGYGSRSSGYYAYSARLNRHGWIGINESSWIQIDLGNRTKVFGSIIQGVSSIYYTSRYSLQYSLDGNHFQNFTDPDGKNLVFSGFASTSPLTSHFVSVMVARFVRFIPVSWKAHSNPGMAVELLGCHEY